MFLGLLRLDRRRLGLGHDERRRFTARQREISHAHVVAIYVGHLAVKVVGVLAPGASAMAELFIGGGATPCGVRGSRCVLRVSLERPVDRPQPLTGSIRDRFGTERGEISGNDAALALGRSGHGRTAPGRSRATDSGTILQLPALLRRQRHLGCGTRALGRAERRIGVRDEVGAAWYRSRIGAIAEGGCP